MINKAHSDKLMLALEPEAAAIHCQTLAITDFMTGKDVKTIDMIPNTTYMIIDAGGVYIYCYCLKDIFYQSHITIISVTRPHSESLNSFLLTLKEILLPMVMDHC